MPELPEVETVRRGLALKMTGHKIDWAEGDCRDFKFLSEVVERFRPDTVVHYAEQPSAPYSMIGYDEARTTLCNNLEATFNIIWAVLKHAKDCHVIKLGTMGEYGTPNIAIEEGHLKPDTDPLQFVFEVHGLILALHHDARFLRSTGAIERVRTAFDRLVGHYAAPAGQRSVATAPTRTARLPRKARG